MHAFLLLPNDILRNAQALEQSVSINRETKDFCQDCFL